MAQRVVTHIQTTNLTKTYGGIPAVQQVSISIRSGNTLVIAGPNGGGKTTLIDCLSGMLDPDDPAALQRPGYTRDTRAIDIRRLVGYAPDEDDTIEFLSALEYFQLVAAAYRKPVDATVARGKKLLQQLDFDLAKSNRLLKSYSHGMKKKVQLAAILAVKPPVIIIDEPTNGLDPTAVILLKKILASPQFSDVALVIATHNLAFAESFRGELLLLQQSPLAYGQSQALLRAHKVDSLEKLYEKLVTVPAHAAA